MLRHCLPPSIRGTLDELPETLDETYERVLRDINKAVREHAIRLLHCLTVAIRPLRVEELAEVLAIDFDATRREGIPKLHPTWRWADQHQAVLSTCSSLIAIVDDGDSQVVQFSHFSVKEYLTSDRLARSGGDVSQYHILLGSAHTILAQACLGILLSLDYRVNSINAGDIPLARYAAEHWVDHARFKNVTTHIQVAMECLFDADKPHHAAWLRVHDIDEEWFWFTPDCIIPCGEPLYYAALCGFYDLVKHLSVKHLGHVNAWGGQIVSPLGAALYRNHFQVAELLHEHGADVHVRGDWERTLLHASAKAGLVDAVRWLLDHGADVNARQDDGWTPLHLAGFNSHLEIARILLEYDADVNARNDDEEVPLHRAACPRDYHDHINTMQLLLEHGADVNARDNEGSTPLHYSSSRRGGDRTHPTKGTVEGTRLLLKHGASINAENSRGETPRQVALIDEHRSIAECLLECGAE
jgi:ankyrin repeat protein